MGTLGLRTKIKQYLISGSTLSIFFQNLQYDMEQQVSKSYIMWLCEKGVFKVLNFFLIGLQINRPALQMVHILLFPTFKPCVNIYRRTLGSDDLIIFKRFRVYFSLKKKIIQFPLSFNLYFQQKRAPKLSICHLPTKRSVWVFDVTNRTNGFSNFQGYHEVVMYLFNSLAKSWTLFWKYS